MTFHSDYSISGSGFSLIWQAVDVSACPLQTLTAKEGFLTSPNYPDFILAHLDCTITILAPAGKRVWLELQNYSLDTRKTEDVSFEISLGQNSLPFTPFVKDGLLTEGNYLSDEEYIKVFLKTGSKPFGNGFKAIYKIISDVNEERVIWLMHNSSGGLLHLNYPQNPTININFLQHFVAPLGCVISLELFHVKLSVNDCDSAGVLEIYDNYYDANGTKWTLCYDTDVEAIVPTTPFSITSFLNTLHLKQRSGIVGVPLNGSLRVQIDEEFKTKILKLKEELVESCVPNPCQNEGKCVSRGKIKFCQCVGHFTGTF